MLKRYINKVNKTVSVYKSGIIWCYLLLDKLIMIRIALSYNEFGNVDEIHEEKEWSRWWYWTGMNSNSDNIFNRYSPLIWLWWRNVNGIWEGMMIYTYKFLFSYRYVQSRCTYSKKLNVIYVLTWILVLVIISNIVFYNCFVCIFFRSLIELKLSLWLN